MSLRQEQSEFARRVPLLIQFAFALDYEVTIEDVTAKTGHRRGSFHYKKLAIDLNLFAYRWDSLKRMTRWKYLKSTAAHKKIGLFWESLHPKCTWGGRFKKPDGCHYSWGEGRRKK